MSSDGLSRNETVVAVSTLTVRKAAPDTHNRRAAEDSQNSPFRRTDSAGARANAKLRYPRYVPSANVAQLLLDLVLIAGSQAIVFTLIRSRLDLSSLREVICSGRFIRRCCR